MCIAILKTEKAVVSKEQLEESFLSNPDGSGYMFANNGNLTTKKGFFKFSDFYNSYSKDMKKFDNPITIIHFRITTHGFKREILQKLPNDFIYDDAIIKLIEESIGNSKLVFLNRKGEFRIANEQKGHWSDDGDIWYSNKSYCELPTTSWSGYNYYDAYQDYEVLNITNKKKTVNKGNKVERTDCRTCQSNLFTIGERQVGHCHSCQKTYKSNARI